VRQKGFKLKLTGAFFDIILERNRIWIVLRLELHQMFSSKFGFYFILNFAHFFLDCQFSLFNGKIAEYFFDSSAFAKTANISSWFLATK